MPSNKISTGYVVSAQALKIFKKPDVMAEFPSTWKRAVVQGVVLGKGSGRKWKVEWTFGSRKLESEHGTCALHVVPKPAENYLPPNVSKLESETEDSSVFACVILNLLSSHPSCLGIASPEVPYKREHKVTDDTKATFSALDWDHPENLHIPPEAPCKREHKVTDDSKATFSALDWDHPENCTANPTAEEGVVTIMGPAKTAYGRAPCLGKTPATALKYIALSVRNLGLSCKTIPGEDSEFSLQAMDAAGSQTNITVRGDELWITVRCEAANIGELIKEALDPSFKLAKLRHKEIAVLAYQARPGYQVTALTGGQPDDIGTLFSLRKGETLIGKALCAYSNSALCSNGPTIEFIEVAAEWQKRGFGTELLEAMEQFYIEKDWMEVSWSVNNVTSLQASRWFQKCGFRAVGCLGEELIKEIGVWDIPDPSSDEDEELEEDEDEEP